MCIDTSRDTGPAGVALNWYRDGIRLDRQIASPWQSYLGWSTYIEFNFNKRIWLKRDEDTKLCCPAEFGFGCGSGRLSRRPSTLPARKRGWNNCRPRVCVSGGYLRTFVWRVWFLYHCDR